MKKAVEDVFGLTFEYCNNVIVLDNQEDYERHLLNAGYETEIIEAIGAHEGDPDFVLKYAQTRDHTIERREKANLPKCPTCHQDIYRAVIRDYSGSKGWRNAIYDCCTSKQAKAKYAAAVAEKIVSAEDECRRIPPKVKELLVAMYSVMS